MTITVTVDSIAQVSVWAIPAGAPPMTLPIPAQEGTITLQPNVPQTFHIPATSGTRYDISVQAINSEAIVVAKLINVQTPFPDNFSFSFPNAGTFGYQCRIHDHMVGTIIATP